MAQSEETTAVEQTAPVISQASTTSVGENTQALQEQPVDDTIAVEQQPSIFNNWLLYAVAALWLYWLFGSKKRRQAKAQEKKEQERRNTLQKGDMIVTVGRLHGVVTAFTDSTVTVRPDPKSDVTMTFDRQALYRVMPRPGEEPDPEENDKK